MVVLGSDSPAVNGAVKLTVAAAAGIATYFVADAIWHAPDLFTGLGRAALEARVQELTGASASDWSRFASGFFTLTGISGTVWAAQAGFRDLGTAMFAAIQGANPLAGIACGS